MLTVIIYLVSGNPVPLFAAIEAGLGVRFHVTIKRMPAAPVGRENQEPSIAILDLGHPPGHLLPPVAASCRMTYIVVIAQGQSIPVEWVGFLRQPAVEVITVGNGASALRYGGISSIVARHRGDHASARAVELLLSKEEWLVSYADLVKVILAAPWTIRDPCDLARATGTPELVLRKRCEAAGFRRVEHFITLVRRLGLEALVGVDHMRASRARMVVGISDPSNFRRQLRRVDYFPRGRVTFSGPVSRDESYQMA